MNLNNNRLYIILFFNILFLLCLSESLAAQSKKSSKKPKAEWTDQLWYGGGINLGFNSDFYNGFQTNLFTFGLSPMAGYKFNSFLSAGPRVSFDWTVAKFNDGFQVFRYNSVDYGVGVFTRAKFLRNFFAHVEYSQLNETYTTGNVINNKLETFRDWRDIFLIGVGYHSNSIVGYEIYVSYNFLEEDDSFRVPIVYRAGITYRF